MSTKESSVPHKVIILGFDGLSPEIIEPMMKKGVLPHFSRIKEQGSYAWPIQELIKGLDGPNPTDAFVFDLLLPDQHAGWQFATMYDGFTTNQANAIPDVSLRQFPFFEKFIAAGQGEATRFPDYDGHGLFAPLGDTNASAQAALRETQYKLLAEAIPAVSFAAAANAIVSLPAG